ncbi:hypothetical protein ZOSMA_95G00490 [Zostera marina]|uniref:KANL3/Tex30 alpha/beta hydrolase-like domain-containing protein n=1 Tax=Zostera marina TaxID=29655 RepID=A0A0K9NI69_ZOSMR|nr:hypothetical protein ZOSMA_95G00490 [Zostera marina]
MVSSSASPPPSKWQKKDGKGDGSPLPLVVFAHGAGAPSSSEWMIRWKKMLQEELGAIDVITFDYPYISGGKRRPPPKAEMLVEYHSTIVEDAIVKYSGHPLILVGKSMGSSH